MCSRPNDQREIDSEKSLRSLGYRYIKIVNSPYDRFPPKETVFRGMTDWIVGITKPDPNQFGLTAGHYGAFQAHMMGIRSAFVDSDFTIICEADCLIAVDAQEFYQRVDEAINLLKENKHHIVRFEAPNFQTNNLGHISGNLYEGNLLINGHCYMVNPNSQDFYLERMKNLGWHTPDWWLNFAFEEKGQRMPYFKDLILTKQAEGYSLIDTTHRKEKERG
jgi:hypothetical protein